MMSNILRATVYKGLKDLKLKFDINMTRRGRKRLIITPVSGLKGLNP